MPPHCIATYSRSESTVTSGGTSCLAYAGLEQTIPRYSMHFIKTTIITAASSHHTGKGYLERGTAKTMSLTVYRKLDVPLALHPHSRTNCIWSWNPDDVCL